MAFLVNVQTGALPCHRGTGPVDFPLHHGEKRSRLLFDRTKEAGPSKPRTAGKLAGGPVDQSIFARHVRSKRFSKVAGALRKDTVKAMRMMELILPILLFIMNVSLMAVLWFGAVEIGNGDAQVGELVAIVNYAMRMTGAFSMFAFIISAFSRAKASSERMEEVLTADDDLENHDMESSGIGSLEGDLRSKTSLSIIQESLNRSG